MSKAGIHNATFLVIGILIGSLYTMWHRSAELPVRDRKDSSGVLQNLGKNGRILASLETHQKDLQDGDVSIIFDSRDVKISKDNHKGQGHDEVKVISLSDKVIQPMRPKTQRANLLEDELSMRHMLHVSVLCQGHQHELTQLAKVTWGQGHEGHIHYFHAKSHQHSLFSQKHTEDIYASGKYYNSKAM